MCGLTTKVNEVAWMYKQISDLRIRFVDLFNSSHYYKLQMSSSIPGKKAETRGVSQPFRLLVTVSL